MNSPHHPEPSSSFTPSARLIQFLKEREGLSRQPDFDGYGTYTVGYGVNYPNRNAALAAIRRLGAVPGRLTDAQATPDLIRMIREKEARLQGTLDAHGHRVWDGLKEHQQDAIRSLFYNLTDQSGIRFLHKYINGDRVGQIPAALALHTGSWSEKNRNGLAYRRRLETRMFLGQNALGSDGPTIADTIQGKRQRPSLAAAARGLAGEGFRQATHPHRPAFPAGGGAPIRIGWGLWRSSQPRAWGIATASLAGDHQASPPRRRMAHLPGKGRLRDHDGNGRITRHDAIVLARYDFNGDGRISFREKRRFERGPV